MDTHGYCNYAHTDRLGRIAKKGEIRKEGAEARVSGERPDEEGGGGTGRRSSGKGASMGSASGQGQQGVWRESSAVGNREGDG